MTAHLAQFNTADSYSRLWGLKNSGFLLAFSLLLFLLLLAYWSCFAHTPGPGTSHLGSFAAIYGVAKSWTWLSDWTELNWLGKFFSKISVQFILLFLWFFNQMLSFQWRFLWPLKDKHCHLHPPFLFYFYSESLLALTYYIFCSLILFIFCLSQLDQLHKDRAVTHIFFVALSLTP